MFVVQIFKLTLKRIYKLSFVLFVHIYDSKNVKRRWMWFSNVYIRTYLNKDWNQLRYEIIYVVGCTLITIIKKEKCPEVIKMTTGKETESDIKFQLDINNWMMNFMSRNVIKINSGKTQQTVIMKTFSNVNLEKYF